MLGVFFSKLSWQLAEFKSPVRNSNFHVCFQWFFFKSLEIVIKLKQTTVAKLLVQTVQN